MSKFGKMRTRKTLNTDIILAVSKMYLDRIRYLGTSIKVRQVKV